MKIIHPAFHVVIFLLLVIGVFTPPMNAIDRMKIGRLHKGLDDVKRLTPTDLEVDNYKKYCFEKRNI